MTFNFVCVFIVAVCLNEISTADDSIAEDYQVQNTRDRTVGRSYSLTTCDYKTQIGYTCLNCNRALHCYAGNVAIIVDCYGFFRYCRDGRCSRNQDEKCADNRLTTPSTNITIQTEASVATTEATTKLLTDVTTTSVTEAEAVTAISEDKSSSTTSSVSDNASVSNDNNDVTTVASVETDSPSGDVNSTAAVDPNSNLV